MEDEFLSILKCFNGKNLYDILELDQLESSHEIIKKQYKKLIKMYHPDNNNKITSDSIKFDEVKKASLVLLNKELKNLYDNKLLEKNEIKNNDFYRNNSFQDTAIFKEKLQKKEMENLVKNDTIINNSYLFKKRSNETSNLPYLSIDEIKNKSYMKKIHSMIKNGVKITLNENCLSTFFVDREYMKNLFSIFGKINDIRCNFSKIDNKLEKETFLHDIYLIEFANDKSSDILIKIYSKSSNEEQLLKFLKEVNIDYSYIVVILLIINKCEKIFEKDLINVVNKENYNVNLVI